MSKFELFDNREFTPVPIPPPFVQTTIEQCFPLIPRPIHNNVRFSQFCDDLHRRRNKSVRKSPCIMYVGPHVIKLGLSRYVNDLIDSGYVDCVATNGAGLIHDFELAMFNYTSEDVPERLRTGDYGRNTSHAYLNDVVRSVCSVPAAGLGERVGAALNEDVDCDMPNALTPEISIAWHCHTKGIPFTSHIGIGTDVTAMHANYDAAVWASRSYVDFMIFTQQVYRFITYGGIFMCFGGAVTAPEVFLKAMGLVQAKIRHQPVPQNSIAVFDIQPISGDPAAPHDHSDPRHYNRVAKQFFQRTSHANRHEYFQMNHLESIPGLWTAMKERDEMDD